MPVQDMSGFMEENAHVVSVMKPKRTGDPKLSVTGCELPSRRLMAKSREGHANVETPGRLLDSY
jgi:hypothetical protein